MTEALADKVCIPCSGGVPPLDNEAIRPLLAALDPAWRVVESHHLFRRFTFEDFAEALDFTNRLGAIADKQWHHPDILLAWGRVDVSIWTHKIDGLTESDFVLAAKFDRVQIEES